MSEIGLSLKEGTVLSGAYRIVRPIGLGGMGEVYEALHLRTGAPAAIKVLANPPTDDTATLERFRREAEVTSRLQHPHIVRVFDFDRLPDGRPFLVMELLAGKDLAALAALQGLPMPIGRVADLVDQISLALFAAHQAGVIHRDLKPANIFVESLPGSTRDLVRVLDFGISKLLGHAAGSLTRTIAVVGTPHYMSPEQATGHSKTIDQRSDQFSLAAIAYELLTARRPFAAEAGDVEDSALAIIYRVAHEEPPTWTALGVTLPIELERVVRRGLAKTPAERFPDIRSFAQAFAAAAASVASLGGGPPQVSTARTVAETLVLAGPTHVHGTTLSLSTGESRPRPDGDAVEARPAPPASPRREFSRRLALSSGAALAILGGVGIWRLWSSSAAPHELAAPPPAGVPARREPVQPPSRVAPPEPAPTAAIEVAPTPRPTVPVEIEGAPDGLRVWEGEDELVLPLTLPADDAVHRLRFRAPGRREIAIDVVARAGARASLQSMSPLSGPTPSRPNPVPRTVARPKAKPVRAPSARNEDIL